MMDIIGRPDFTGEIHLNNHSLRWFHGTGFYYVDSIISQNVEVSDPWTGQSKLTTIELVRKMSQSGDFFRSENDASFVVILFEVLSFYILTIEKVISFEYAFRYRICKSSKFTSTEIRPSDPQIQTYA